MTTISGNIAGTIRPFGVLKRGEVVDVSDIFKKKKKKRKKKKSSVYEMVSVGGVAILCEKKEKKYTVDGKQGVWRTIRGRHYFFPDDKSGPIPPFKGE